MVSDPGRRGPRGRERLRRQPRAHRADPAEGGRLQRDRAARRQGLPRRVRQDRARGGQAHPGRLARGKWDLFFALAAMKFKNSKDGAPTRTHPSLPSLLSSVFSTPSALSSPYALAVCGALSLCLSLSPPLSLSASLTLPHSLSLRDVRLQARRPWSRATRS